ncbi:hypothetical protein WA158_007592 [Blastocystis sp. Blastoise]
MDANLVAAIKRGNPVCFLDIAIAGNPIGRIKLELFKNICPKTVENFRQFCVGEHKRSGMPVGYKGSRIHRILKEYIIQGGDFVRNDGTGKMSIYGETFADENFELKHDQPGLLAMANSGPNTNGCQFYITCNANPTLDGKYVVFGKVLDTESMKIVRMIENVSVNTDETPKVSVAITECGEL